MNYVSTFVAFTKAGLIISIIAFLFFQRQDNLERIFILNSWLHSISAGINNDFVQENFGPVPFIAMTVSALLRTELSLKKDYVEILLVLPFAWHMFYSFASWKYESLFLRKSINVNRVKFTRNQAFAGILLSGIALGRSFTYSIDKVYTNAFLTLARGFILVILTLWCHMFNRRTSVENWSSKFLAPLLLAFVDMMSSFNLGYKLFVYDIASFVVLLVATNFSSTNVHYDASGGTAQTLIEQTTLGFIKMTFEILRSEVFITLVSVFLGMFLLMLSTAVWFTSHVEFRAEYVQYVKEGFDFVNTDYKRFVELRKQDWFTTVFFPLNGDIEKVVSKMKGVLNLSYPMAKLISNGYDFSFTPTENIVFLIPLLLSSLSAMMQILKVYEPFNLMLQKRSFWAIDMFGSIVSLFLLQGLCDAEAAFWFVALSPATYTRSYTQNGKFAFALLLINFVIVMMQYIKQIRADNKKKQNEKGLTVERENFSWVIKEAGVSLRDNLFKASTIALIVGVLLFMLVAKDGNPIRSADIVRKQDKAPEWVQDSTSTEGWVEGKLLPMLSRRAINLLWLAKGINYGFNQIPCIDVGVTKICIGDLLSSGVNGLQSAAEEGINKAIEAGVTAGKALTSTFDADLNFMDGVWSAIEEKALKISIATPDLLQLDIEKPQVPDWLIWLTVALLALTVIFAVLSIWVKAAEMFLYPTFASVATCLLSAFMLAWTFHGLIRDNGYEIRVVFRSNLNLLLASTVTIFASFFLRLAESMPNKELKEIKEAHKESVEMQHSPMTAVRKLTLQKSYMLMDADGDHDPWDDIDFNDFLTTLKKKDLFKPQYLTKEFLNQFPPTFEVGKEFDIMDLHNEEYLGHLLSTLFNGHKRIMSV